MVNACVTMYNYFHACVLINLVLILNSPCQIAHSLVYCNVFGNSSKCPKFSVKNIRDIL